MPTAVCLTSLTKRGSRRKPLTTLPRLNVLPRAPANRPRRRIVRARRLPQDILAMAELDAALEAMTSEDTE